MGEDSQEMLLQPTNGRISNLPESVARQNVIAGEEPKNQQYTVRSPETGG
jgi:hypothetical protein